MPRIRMVGIGIFWRWVFCFCELIAKCWAASLEGSEGHDLFCHPAHKRSRIWSTLQRTASLREVTCAKIKR